jgi:translation initiation factor IF-3
VDLGKKLLLRFAQDLSQVGSIEGQPKLEGRNAHVIISPVKTATPPKPEKGKAGPAGPGGTPGGAPSEPPAAR